MRLRVVDMAIRDTPTGVGKIEAIRRDCKAWTGHPHRRGEDEITESMKAIDDRDTPTGVGKIEEADKAGLITNGTPPQAWGR